MRIVLKELLQEMYLNEKAEVNDLDGNTIRCDKVQFLLEQLGNNILSCPIQKIVEGVVTTYIYIVL